ncbi:MAG: hypothetical protein JSW65_05840, partial [Candidatus Bipolaricaulota bacterium]
VTFLVGFLDPPSLYPTPASGGGNGIRSSSAYDMCVDALAQLLYPWALPTPWLTIGGGWSR